MLLLDTVDLTGRWNCAAIDEWWWHLAATINFFFFHTHLDPSFPVPSFLFQLPLPLPLSTAKWSVLPICYLKVHCHGLTGQVRFKSSRAHISLHQFEFLIQSSWAEFTRSGRKSTILPICYFCSDNCCHRRVNNFNPVCYVLMKTDNCTQPSWTCWNPSEIRLQ